MEQINSTTWKNVVQDNPKDRIEVEIGDSKQADICYPQVKIMRWDNEVNFSVRLKDTEYDKAQVKKEGEKIKWSKGNIDIHCYKQVCSSLLLKGIFWRLSR